MAGLRDSGTSGRLSGKGKKRDRRRSSAAGSCHAWAVRIPPTLASVNDVLRQARLAFRDQQTTLLLTVNRTEQAEGGRDGGRENGVATEASTRARVGGRGVAPPFAAARRAERRAVFQPSDRPPDARSPSVAQPQQGRAESREACEPEPSLGTVPDMGVRA